MIDAFRMSIDEQWPQDGQETIVKEEARKILFNLSDKEVTDEVYIEFFNDGQNALENINKE